jgi:hypothetical protein
MNNDAQVHQFIEEQLNLFTEEVGKKPSQLLELAMLNLSFVDLIYVNFEPDEAMCQRLMHHTMKCLELCAAMAGIPEAEVNSVLDKSIELVDCMQAIADPKHTNVH